MEDQADPPEGSEEAAELRMDTPGEGSCWSFRQGVGWDKWGKGWPWRQIWEAGILVWGEPRPYLPEIVAALPATGSHSFALHSRPRSSSLPRRRC